MKDWSARPNRSHLSAAMRLILCAALAGTASGVAWGQTTADESLAAGTSLCSALAFIVSKTFTPSGMLLRGTMPKVAALVLKPSAPRRKIGTA